MANEFRHGDVGTELTEAEYDSLTGHSFASQATGDVMYASSTTQLTRLGIGSTGQVLVESGGIPAWSSTIAAALTFTANQTFNDSVETRYGTGGDSRIYYNGTDTFWDLRRVGTGDLMIALAGSFPSPDPGAVHIWAGTAGSQAAHSEAMFVLEDSGSMTAQVLLPDANEFSLRVGGPTSSSSGVLRYYMPSATPANTWGIYTAATERIRISANAFAFQEATTISSTTGNITIGAAAGADVLIGDDVTILAVDGGTGNVLIGAPTTTTHALNILTTGEDATHVESTTAGSVGPQVRYYHNSSSPADNDDIVTFAIYGNDDGATSRIPGLWAVRFKDVTSTTMDSEMRFSVMNNVNSGNANTTATLTSAGVWTDASGEKYKEYEGTSCQVWGGRDGYVITDKLKQLQFGRYHAIGSVVDDIHERHVSPTAEAFYDLFGVGRDPREVIRGETTPGLAAKDIAGVALLGVQELIARVEALEAR